MSRFLFLFIGFTLLAGLSQNVLAQKEIPELWGQRVHDEAKVLSQQTIDNLEHRLKIFEDSTSNQIAVLIEPSLDGEVMEQYTLRVAEKWKLGKKERDNGALLFIAVNDRKMRIEVGQGLEGPLPDAICNRIIRNEMAPNFRRGDYDAGVMAATDAIMKAIKGEYKADPRSASGNGISSRLIFFIIILAFGLLRYLARGGKRSGGWSSGAGWFIGGGGWGGGGGGGGGGGFSGGGGSFGGGGSSGSW